MSKTITATQASREFSEMLNVIKYTGEQYTILRGGKPITHLGPVQLPVGGKRLGDLHNLLQALPRLGHEGEFFRKYLRAAVKKQPALPQGGTWG